MNNTAFSSVPKINCPLMTQGSRSFENELCACDIPRTRVIFLRTSSVCHNGSACLPRECLSDETKAESEPCESDYVRKQKHCNA